ncbi:facilitated trehalose transporter Tret1-like [Neocloeon triangulifer]|uniref:facilitated trehalose transporter Tret1-like n=1 Tax=Neocloeon triangulifer TaxID=2078957 RepID=UPI00286FAD7F|nr:facilitated trehalose transporter Tret1-like [Neocloeon triangulifer]
MTASQDCSQVASLGGFPRLPAPPSLSRSSSNVSSTLSKDGCTNFTVRVVSNTRYKHLSQVLAALAVSLGPLAAGLGKGYSSPAIASLQEIQESRELARRSKPNLANVTTFHDGFPVSEQQASWVASLSLLGALFGGAMAGVALRYGRRRILIVCAVPFSASWLLTVFATSVEMMFATAFAGGYCCALVLLVTQVYVSEIASPEVRGALSAMLKVANHVGVLLSFVLGAYINWRQLACVLVAAPLLLLVASAWLPESPSFLLVQGREQEAAQALQWLRGPQADITCELATLRSNVLRPKSHLRWRPQMWRPVLLTCGLMFFQRFSGAHAFNFYAVPILRQTLGSGVNAHAGAIVVSIVQLLAALASGLLIDRVGRVPLLAASLALMAASLAGFGAAASQGAASAWLQLSCVLLFTVAFSLGIAPIPWLLLAELFPLEDRGAGAAIGTGFSYTCAFIGVKTFVDFQQWLGIGGAFWLYSLIAVAGLFFVLAFVPETKGRDLEGSSDQEQQA